ncbi:MAG: hypothetical protein ACTHN5_03115 [Phycisphaerae bacterium]
MVGREIRAPHCPVSFYSFVTLVSNNKVRASSSAPVFLQACRAGNPGKKAVFAVKNAILRLAKFLFRAHNTEIRVPAACSLDHQHALHGGATAQR